MMQTIGLQDLERPLPEACPQCILVVDDHEAVLQGTVPILRAQYPAAQIMTARDRATAWQLGQAELPELVVVDLSIPETVGGKASPSIGLNLLEQLMTLLPAPNVLVMTASVTALMRIRPKINTYGGGFAALDKANPLEAMAGLIDIAMRGAVHLPGLLRSRAAFEPDWLDLLHYRFEEGWTDRAIAKHLDISERTIRNYWVRIQDCLGIRDEPGLDSRVKIEIEARRLGLLG